VSAIQTSVKTNAQIAEAARSRRTRARRQRWYAVVISLCTLTAIACLATIADFSTVIPFLTSFENLAPAPNPREERTGTIVHEGDMNRCEQMTFDNESGRTIEYPAPCGNRNVLDAHGVPIPQGTVHRLDAISKSFFGH
jgi:hypothetical protein